MLILNRARVVLFLDVRVVHAGLGVRVGILLHALASSSRHSGRKSLAIQCRLAGLALILVQRRERVHTIRSLTRIVEGIASNAERLLPSRSQLRLLMGASNVHGQRLTLGPHKLRVATILIS